MEDHKKSKFSVTCNLLSQYLKQKGSLGDLIGLDMTPKPLNQPQAKGLLGKSRTPTTMCLLPGADVSEDNQTPHDSQDSPKSMDLFPQHAGLDATTEEELKAQQLTIFYDGKVLVYDNFPADKANDLFKMANKEIKKCAQNVEFKVPSPVVARADANSKPKPANDNTNNNNTVSTSGSQSAVVASESNLPKPTNASDMPIARRNSLHRFLEKRKDRIHTKAPYQVHGQGSSSQNAEKPEDVPAWLGLGRKDSKPGDREGTS